MVQTRICYKLNIVNGKLTLNNNIHLIAHTHAIENSDTIRESFRMHAIVSIRNIQTTTHDFDFDFHINSTENYANGFRSADIFMVGKY